MHRSVVYAITQRASNSVFAFLWPNGLGAVFPELWARQYDEAARPAPQPSLGIATIFKLLHRRYCSTYVHHFGPSRGFRFFSPRLARLNNLKPPSGTENQHLLLLLLRVAEVFVVVVDEWYLHYYY